MSVGQPVQGTTFKEVGLKGNLKILLIVGISLLIAGLAMYPALGALKPVSKSGNGSTILINFTVTPYAKQPIKIVLSHTFRIHVEGLLFFSVIGPDPVVINMTITQLGGTYTFAKVVEFTVPMAISQPQGASEYSMSTTINAELSPGTYNIEAQANDVVSCSVIQDFKYADFQNGVCGIAIVGALMAVLWFYLTSKTIESKKTAAARQNYQAYAAQYQYGTPQPYSQYYQNLYAKDGVQAVPNQQPSYSYGQQYPGYGQQPAYGPGTVGTGQPVTQQSNLAYREGGIYTELVCNSCMQIVRSTPVDGVVTCEHCGDKARLY